MRCWLVNFVSKTWISLESMKVRPSAFQGRLRYRETSSLGGSERCPTQAPGEWHRRQRSPAFGVPSAQIESCSATVTEAQNRGSHEACAIIDPRQREPGSTAASYPAWQFVQRLGPSNSAPLAGCVPGIRTNGSPSTVNGVQAAAPAAASSTAEAQRSPICWVWVKPRVFTRLGIVEDI